MGGEEKNAIFKVGLSSAVKRDRQLGNPLLEMSLSANRMDQSAFTSNENVSWLAELLVGNAKKCRSAEKSVRQ